MTTDRWPHAFRLMGAAAGWEVYECVRCHRSAIPSPFGFLWPNLGWRFRRWTCLPKCSAVYDDDVIVGEVGCRERQGHDGPHVMDRIASFTDA